MNFPSAHAQSYNRAIIDRQTQNSAILLISQRLALCLVTQQQQTREILFLGLLIVMES